MAADAIPATISEPVAKVQEPSVHSGDETTLAENPRSRLPSVSSMNRLGSSSTSSPSNSPPKDKEMALPPAVTIAPKEQYPGFRDLAKQRSVLSTREATQGRTNKQIMTELKREASRGVSPYPGKGTKEDPYIVDW